jgi:hypothetical protein
MEICMWVWVEGQGMVATSARTAGASTSASRPLVYKFADGKSHNLYRTCLE